MHRFGHRFVKWLEMIAKHAKKEQMSKSRPVQDCPDLSENPGPVHEATSPSWTGSHFPKHSSEPNNFIGKICNTCDSIDCVVFCTCALMKKTALWKERSDSYRELVFQRLILNGQSSGQVFFFQLIILWTEFMWPSRTKNHAHTPKTMPWR